MAVNQLDMDFRKYNNPGQLDIKLEGSERNDCKVLITRIKDEQKDQDNSENFDERIRPDLDEVQTTRIKKEQLKIEIKIDQYSSENFDEGIHLDLDEVQTTRIKDEQLIEQRSSEDFDERILPDLDELQTTRIKDEQLKDQDDKFSDSAEGSENNYVEENLVDSNEDSKSLLQGKEGDEKKNLENEVNKTLHKAFICTHCNMEFKYQTVLVRHIEEEHINICKGQILKCDECLYKTSNQLALEKHMKRHDKNRPHICYICSHRFLKRTNLKDHLKTHSNENKCAFANYNCLTHKFLCPIKSCEFKTRRRHNLMRHIATHSTDIFKCTLCDYKSQTKYNLRSHINRKHAVIKPPLPIATHDEVKSSKKEDPDTRSNKKRSTTNDKILPQKFLCSSCDFKTCRSYSLKRHIAKHSTDILNCTLCDYTSKNTYNLQKHVKKKHT